jgi:hypothetical protein
MTKEIGFCIIILFQSFYAYVQNTSAYGELNPDEKTIVKCDFQKDAPALVLFDVGKFACFFYQGHGITTEFTRHIRIKILNEKGLNQADIEIPYYNSAGEKIKDLVAQTFNTDGSGNWEVSSVEKNLIYDKPENNRVSKKIFVFPDVKVGSIIEYKYTVADAGLHNWYFQKDIPVKFSSYKVDFPHDFQLLSTPLCVLPVEQGLQKDRLRISRIFVMRDIVPLGDEPFIGRWEDYLQRIESNFVAFTTSHGRYNLMPGWPTIITELMGNPDFGIQLRKDPPKVVELETTLKNVRNPFERMTSIYKYVQENFEWNGVNNIWSAKGIKATWDDRKGTTGDINIFLINLLKHFGLEVYPMLVSTRNNGKVYLERPGAGQFNKVLAYVKIADKKYVLDATDSNTPSNLIPFDVMNTWSLVIKKAKNKVYDWEWLSDEKRLYKNDFIITGNIAENGIISGSAEIHSYDYARVERYSRLKSDKEKFISEKLIANNEDVSIDTFYTLNTDKDTLPLIQKLQFSYPVSNSGDYKYFSTNIFTGLSENPFVADSRFSDIFFGVIQQYNIESNFTAPAGYTFEDIRKTITLALPDSSISITRIADVSENNLTVSITLRFNKPIYAVNKYNEFKEFYKKVFEILNEQYIVRKSKS